ncbi:hypothetical protein F383_18344 [Gossypium arboreum]|uniref:Uncharacterized protein n=1 Tax=Gossypium arboreum TaxID=29729 RepID=A0A0B0NNX5_GOSAR|nr:hypothetical protein F383_18344 [Gossypium arboreum]
MALYMFSHIYFGCKSRVWGPLSKSSTLSSTFSTIKSLFSNLWHV